MKPLMKGSPRVGVPKVGRTDIGRPGGTSLDGAGISNPHPGNDLLLSGDMQSGTTDVLLLSGDMQSGTTDTLLLSGVP